MIAAKILWPYSLCVIGNKFGIQALGTLEKSVKAKDINCHIVIGMGRDLHDCHRIGRNEVTVDPFYKPFRMLANIIFREQL